MTKLTKLSKWWLLPAFAVLGPVMLYWATPDGQGAADSIEYHGSQPNEQALVGLVNGHVPHPAIFVSVIATAVLCGLLYWAFIGFGKRK